MKKDGFYRVGDDLNISKVSVWFHGFLALVDYDNIKHS